MKPVLLGLFLVCSALANNTTCPHYCICREKQSTILCDNKNLTSVDIFHHQRLPSWAVHLTLTYNSIRTLQDYIFQNLSLTGVKQLELGNNSLTYIGRYAFEGMKTLETLDLSYNNISHLDPETFNSTISLSLLQLSYNPLKALNGVFLVSTSIESLRITSSNLSYISPEAFEGMPELKFLRLADNKLTKVEPSTFILLPSLHFLFISGNPFICGPEYYILIKHLKLKGIFHPNVRCIDGADNSTSAVNSAIPDKDYNEMSDLVEDMNSSEKLSANVEPPINYTIPTLIIGTSIIVSVLIVILYKHFSMNQIKVRRFNSSTTNSYPDTSSSYRQF